RVFHLPIHLEAKWAAVRPLALRDRLRDGFLRRGWHGYGGARLSRRRCHLMISFGRARTVSAAPLLHHARSKDRVSQQIRTRERIPEKCFQSWWHTRGKRLNKARLKYRGCTPFSQGLQ